MASATFKLRTDGRQRQSETLRAAGASNWRRLIRRPSVILTILLTAFFLIQSCVPLRTAVQIGADEGFELAKATLSLKGYRLYSEVWNDQPPLHTFLITQILKNISPTILGPRLVTSVFAAVLLASVFFISLRVSGLFVAALATALLIVSPGFVELSSSCMLEIPALAPAVAALGVLLIGGQSKRQLNPNRIAETAEHAEYAKGRSRDSFTLRVKRTATLNAASHALFLRGPRISRFTPIASSTFKDVLAGVLFGVAFQIKLVNVILLPLAALIVWLRQHENGFSPCLNQPTPDPSQEGNSASAASHRRPSTAGAGGGFMNKAARAGNSRDGVTLLRSLLFLAVSLAISFVAIDYLIDRGAFLLHFQQSWSSHFTAAKSFEYGSADDHPFDWSIFLKNWDTSVPALLGITLLLRAKLPALYSRDRMSLGSPSLRLSLFPDHRNSPLPADA